MSENLTPAQYEVVLRHDFVTFAMRCFQDLNPQTDLAMNWHLEIIAAKLTAVREGKIRRLIINLPPRHLKSLMASIAFPAWCLGHDPSAQILCVSYAQDLSDKLARDCRSIMLSPWYRQIFPTRLGPHRQAVQEFITTRQGYRLATSTGGVLTGRGTICQLQRFCGSYNPKQDQSGLDNGLLLDSRQAGTFPSSASLSDYRMKAAE